MCQVLPSVKARMTVNLHVAAIILLNLNRGSFHEPVFPQGVATEIIQTITHPEISHFVDSGCARHDSSLMWILSGYVHVNTHCLPGHATLLYMCSYEYRAAFNL